MRKLTEAQVEAAKKRREHFREVVKAVSKMTDEQRAALSQHVPNITVEGHTLSFHNQLLIAFQAGDRSITIVGGFRQWIKQGRAVRKGEHGFTIWIPSIPKKDDPEQASDEEIRFFTGTVFDISQTEPVRADPVQAEA